MSKPITIELPPDDRNLRRMISELGRRREPENHYFGLSESEIAYQLLVEASERSLRRISKGAEEAIANLREARDALEEQSRIKPIAPGSYTRETLPPLGGRAQTLLDSIWESAEKRADDSPASLKRRAKFHKPRGRLKLTDHGGESVIEYLAKR